MHVCVCDVTDPRRRPAPGGGLAFSARAQAARNGYTECVQALLATNRISLNEGNRHGRTALHWAAYVLAAATVARGRHVTVVATRASSHPQGRERDVVFRRSWCVFRAAVVAVVIAAVAGCCAQVCRIDAGARRAAQRRRADQRAQPARVHAAPPRGRERQPRVRRSRARPPRSRRRGTR